MLRNLLFICLYLLAPVFAFAQDGQEVKWVVSAEAIEQGIIYHDEKNYEKAIELYTKVHPNDSNYALALYELTISYISAEKYPQAIDAAQKGLKLNSIFDHLFYQQLGNAYDLNKQFDEAMKAYDEGIAKYPFYYNYWYEKGMSCKNHNRDAQAVEAFQKGINLNPWYASCHYQLGLLAAKHDRPTMAFLALGHFLLIEPNSIRSFVAMNELDEIAKKEKKYNPDSVVSFPGKGDNFSDLDKMIRDGDALKGSAKFMKVPHSEVFKNMKMVFEKLKYDKNDPGFWTQTYGKHIAEMQKNEHFDAYAYHVLSSNQSKDVQAGYKRNLSQILAMRSGVVERINEVRKEGPKGFPKPYGLMEYHYSDEGYIHAIGNTFESNGTRYARGKWYYFYKSGNLAAEGSFDDNANKTSLWKGYYPNKVLKEEIMFAEGIKNGTYKLYYPNGILKQKYDYRYDRIVGTIYNYYENGELKSEIPVKDVMRDGLVIEYYKSGVVASRTMFRENEMDGEMNTFHSNGKPKLEAKTVSGLLQGPIKSYYYDGTLEMEGAFLNDKRDGTWKTYHSNGKLSRIDHYKSGLKQDTTKEYSSEGVLESISVYNKKGSEIFTASYDKRDAKLYSEITSGKVGITQIKYLDKDGNVVYEAVNKKSTMPLRGYYPSGVKRFDGDLVKGFREGAWTYYTYNGPVDETYVYANGMANGPYKSYYNHGGMHMEGYMKDDERDGLYKFYFRSGVKSGEGYYREGSREGEWVTINELGNITEREYYVEDKLYGLQTYYYPNGKVRKTIDLRPDKLETVCFFDTTGKCYLTLESKTGEHQWQEKYMNGNTSFEVPVKGGIFHGPAVAYHPNGKIKFKIQYSYGHRQGLLEEFDHKGRKTLVGNYVGGQWDGKWVWFDTEGDTELVSHYKAGTLEGERIWFSETGKREVSYTYKEGDLDGYAYRWAPDGSLRVRLRYNQDRLVSYTYLDQNGNLKPETPIEKETVDIVAYFPNGQKSAEMSYKNGWREGDFRYYHTNGKLAEERHYKNSEETGVRKIYSENGTLIAELTYVQDDLHGACRYYYPNGKLKTECNYYLDEKHGIAKWYDEKGKLKDQVDYVFDAAYPLQVQASK